MYLNCPNPVQIRFDIARGADRPAGRWVQRDESIMGTAVGVELWADDGRGGEAATAVLDEIHRIDRVMSTFKPGSEISRINREAGRRAVGLSEEMFILLQRALAFSRLSDGAFDITYAAVGQLYDYRQQLQPSAEALAKARAFVGWQQVQLDAAARTVRFAREGVRIDLGGFAKGHALDRAAAILQRRGISHAVVGAGSDRRVIGDRRGRPWPVDVRDPRRAGQLLATLPLEDASISTAGDDPRHFAAGGQRIHALIDPATGTCPQHVQSVTVVAGDGLTSEAVGKAVFVRGPQRGLALVESLPGVDAIVVDAAGAVHVSTGLIGSVAATPTQ